jgi:fructoselysine-6-P-deglycase FrlB-like protein
MKWQIKKQPQDLARFADSLKRNRMLLPISTRMTFTGSGDSWAAALFAKEAAKDVVVAEDPYELSKGLTRARNGTIVIISVSGRTRANVELATMARTKGRRTIAITSSAESPLARTCEASLILSYQKAGTLTSGTTSFTSSLVACAKLLGRLPRTIKVEQALSEAEKWASGINLPSRGLCLFVGSGVDRALAEYGACKVQEVLGLKAMATYPEQVGHSLLFSLDPAHDTVVCIDSFGKGKTRELHEHLTLSGFRVHKIFLDGKDALTNSIAIAFHLQYLSLFNAERMGLRDCAFLGNRARLELSNKLIY